MSVTETATDGGTTDLNMPKINLSAEDMEELRLLDAAVDRIRKQIPETPYIVTVPCSEPRYHHPDRQRAQSWCKDTPFTPDEERLQYMSFIYREPGTDCFVLRTEVDEERDRRKFYGLGSGTSTPMRSTGPKEKISFAAYKNRQANGGAAKRAGSEGVDNKDQAHVNGAKPEAQQPNNVSQPAAIHGHKRSFDEAADSKASQTKTDEASPPPPKKARTSPPPPTKPTADPSPPSQSSPHGLPPMLSPTGIPNTHGLPPLLSPTLPDNIEAELERIDQAKKAGRTATPVSDKKNPSTARPATTASAKSVSSGSRSSGSDAPPKGVARVVKKEDPPSPSDRKSEAKKQASTSSVKPALEPAEGKLKRPAIDGDAQRPSKQPRASTPPAEKESLVVKLKYGKKNRMLVKQILKLPQGRTKIQSTKTNAQPEKRDAQSRLKKEASSSTSPSPSPNAADRPKKTDTPIQKERPKPPKEAPKKVVEKPQTVTARPGIGEKRPRPRDDDTANAPPVKRQKPPSALDLDKKPSTPAQAAIPSPALSNRSSAQKTQHLAPTSQLASSSQHLTPKKDHRIAMIRSNSTDSPSNTPKPAASTPSASQPTTTNNPAPTSAPNGKATDIQLLLSRSRQLNDLGRKLKHATTAIMSKTSPASPRTSIADDERKRAAVQALECILTYMLAYHAADEQMRLQRKPADVDGNWVTLIPLWKFFRSATQEWAELEALRLRLGVVICARIAEALTRRAADQQRQSQAELQSLADRDQDLLIRHIEVQMLSAREAEARMGFEDMVAKFPKTWEGRGKKGEEAKEKEKVNKPVTDFSGPYKLPIDAVTPPVMAVRAGLAFLEEWCESEKVEWEAQLKLE